MGGLTREELETLTCVGGRPEGGLPIGRKMEHFVTGIGGPNPFPSACTLTHAYCVCDGCDGTCAGSGSCGEPSSACGVRGEFADSADCKGALTDVAAVCPVVSSDIFNGGNIPQPDPDGGFDIPWWIWVLLAILLIAIGICIYNRRRRVYICFGLIRIRNLNTKDDEEEEKSDSKNDLENCSSENHHSSA